MASDSVANKARVIWTRRRRLRDGAGPPEAMLETAGWTRGCRRRAVAPVLPDEVVVWEILVRLPAKALLRCRTACRSWHRLTSDPGFLAAHHRRQPSLPLIKFSAMRDGLVVRDRPFEEEDVTLHACDLRRRGPPAERRPVVCLTPYGHRYTFHASCDGLLLLFSYDEFYICNPATRECASFPGMAGTAGVAGMYLHRASGEYRVLHWRWKKTGDAQMTRPATYYYVLAVGSSEAPRPVIVRSSGMEAAVLAAGMAHDQSECRPTAPVMLHGCLHWDPGSWRWDRVVVFDTVQETFRSMSSPAPAAASLLEMDGTLGISSCDASDGTVRIWLLQDYGSEAWSLRFRIQLPTMEKTLAVAQVMSLNGETLVCYSDGVFASSSALFRWDNKGGMMLKEFRWRTLEPTITGHWFKESLVRHAFFQTQDGALGLQPCLFQGL